MYKVILVMFPDYMYFDSPTFSRRSRDRQKQLIFKLFVIVMHCKINNETCHFYNSPFAVYIYNLRHSYENRLIHTMLL